MTYVSVWLWSGLKIQACLFIFRRMATHRMVDTGAAGKRKWWNYIGNPCNRAPDL